MLITPEELALHSLTINKTYPAGELDDRGSEFRQIASLRLHARAELVGSEIRIRGHLGTCLEVDCDRCAALMEFPLEQSFDLYYRPVSSIAREEEIQISPDELEVAFYSGAGIEIADMVKEQIILALPMKRVCRPDCRGLCSVCGANLNVESCQCEQPRSDSPFASLSGS